MPVKSVQIKLDKIRHLRFGFNALCALEKVGYSLLDLKRMFPDPKEKTPTPTAGLSDLRVLLWAGLLHEDEQITLHGVGQMLDDCNWTSIADEIGKSIGEAIIAAFPEAKEPGKNVKGSKRKSGTGKSSLKKTIS